MFVAVVYKKEGFFVQSVDPCRYVYYLFLCFDADLIFILGFWSYLYIIISKTLFFFMISTKQKCHKMLFYPFRRHRKALITSQFRYI